MEDLGLAVALRDRGERGAPRADVAGATARHRRLGRRSGSGAGDADAAGPDLQRHEQGRRGEGDAGEREERRGRAGRQPARASRAPPRPSATRRRRNARRACPRSARTARRPPAGAARRARAPRPSATSRRRGGRGPRPSPAARRSRRAPPGTLPRVRRKSEPSAPPIASASRRASPRRRTIAIRVKRVKRPEAAARWAAKSPAPIRHRRSRRALPRRAGAPVQGAEADRVPLGIVLLEDLRLPPRRPLLGLPRAKRDAPVADVHDRRRDGAAAAVPLHPHAHLLGREPGMEPPLAALERGLRAALVEPQVGDLEQEVRALSVVAGRRRRRSGGRARRPPARPASGMAPTSSRTRSRTASAEIMSVFGRTSTNSSPPQRQPASTARSDSRTTRAVRTRTLSPTGWPIRSLIDLKPFRSIMPTARMPPERSAREISRGEVVDQEAAVVEARSADR